MIDTIWSPPAGQLQPEVEVAPLCAVFRNPTVDGIAVNGAREPVSGLFDKESTMMDIGCLDDASYVLGALTPAEERAFLQHLPRCPSCRFSVARLEQLPWLLALTDLPSIDLPEQS